MFKNLSWIFASNFAPLLVGIVTIPIMIDMFGLELFGLLTIIWALVGYMSLFDLGLGRALTYAISSKIGDDVGKDQISEIYSVGMVVIVGLALLAGIILFLVSDYLVSYVFAIEAENITVSALALKISGITIVFTVIATGYRGVLEGFGLFRIVSLGRIPLGIWMFIGPLIFFVWTENFAYSILAITLGRILLVIFYWAVCRSYVSFRLNSLSLETIKYLLSFGGWMTVSNVISPVMVYFDRMFIASFYGLNSVSFYTTPYEIVSKALLVPASIGTVLFPKLAGISGEDRKAELRSVSRLGYILNFAITAPLIPFVYFFGEFLLALWIDPEFATKSKDIATILSIGVFFNSLASVPYNLIQSRGWAKKTALVHLFEVPLYVVAILYSIKIANWGLEGIAWIWVARMCLDWILLEFVARKSAHE